MSRILRHSNWDALLIGLSFAHPAALYAAPSIPLIALGVWWNSNTISHNFLHLPFFRSATANRFFSLYLSLVLGIPQTLWRDRHLAHHREQSPQLHWTPAILMETALILALWLLMAVLMPFFFWKIYIPGYALGLGFCYLHGYFEHAGGAATSHYGTVYNFSFFNDGYHVEHHSTPGAHWAQLPKCAAGEARSSRWPAVLRWIEIVNLQGLENVALRSRTLQSLLLKTHEKALIKLLAKLPPINSATIVGGGMYPRTALLLRRLLPHASIRIIDANAEHLDRAKPFLHAVLDGIEFRHERYIPGQPEESDLLIIPLSFNGVREEVYRNPPTAVLVHDWIWSKRGQSAIVSLLLMKRLNLITR